MQFHENEETEIHSLSVGPGAEFHEPRDFAGSSAYLIESNNEMNHR